MSKHDEQEHGRDAMVHALLQEELAISEAQTSTDDILSRFATGDGERAFAQLEQHDQRAQVLPTQGWLAQRWQFLCAALALIALTATFTNSWLGGGDPNGNNGSAHRTDDPQPDQQDPTKQNPVRGLDLAGLQKLLPEVKRIYVEGRRLPDKNNLFGINIAGAPIDVTTEFRTLVLRALGNDVEEAAAIDADWMNEIRFVLTDGRSIRMAYYPYEEALPGGAAEGIRLHVAGMENDLFVQGGGLLPDLVSIAIATGKKANGVITRPHEFELMPVDTEGLQLYSLFDKDLAGLSRFKNLRKLDCKGLQKTLGEEGLRHIQKHCPQLRELTLDGMAFPDDLMMQLTNLVHLTKLSMRGVREFTGTGFWQYSLSALRRDGPTTVDLSFVPTLTDQGMKRICDWDPATLILRNSSKNITAAGLQELARTKNLRRLDLRKWDLGDESYQTTIRNLQRRDGLVIIR